MDMNPDQNQLQQGGGPPSNPPMASHTNWPQYPANANPAHPAPPTTQIQLPPGYIPPPGYPVAPPAMGTPIEGQNLVRGVIRSPQVNQWRHNMCGCMDDLETSCMAMWVPCVVVGENARALGHDCAGYGAAFMIAQMVGLGCVMGMLLRQEIREARGIEGDSCNDCLVWSFIPCCGLVQEAREIKCALQEAPVNNLIARA